MYIRSKHKSLCLHLFTPSSPIGSRIKSLRGRRRRGWGNTLPGRQHWASNYWGPQLSAVVTRCLLTWRLRLNACYVGKFGLVVHLFIKCGQYICTMEYSQCMHSTLIVHAPGLLLRGNPEAAFQTLSVMCSCRAYSYVCLVNTVGQPWVSSLRLVKVICTVVAQVYCSICNWPPMWTTWCALPPSPSFLSLYYRTGSCVESRERGCNAATWLVLRLCVPHWGWGLAPMYIVLQIKDKLKTKFCKPRSITLTTSKWFPRHFWNTVVWEAITALVFT